MAKEEYSREDLVNYKQAQKLAYEAVQYVEGQLFEGVTEKEAAQMVEAYLKNKGIRHFFHHAFAWFGDRTCFKGFEKPPTHIDLAKLLELPHFGRQFQPSDRRLEKGMAVTLDVAPAIEGCAADIGYSFSFGKNDLVAQGLKDLEEFRTLILDGVRKEKTLGAIYREVDDLIKWLGYENVHSYYPGSVLGHKVGKLPATFFSDVTYLGFDVQTFAYLGFQKVQEMFSLGKDPLWGPFNKVPAEAGLWAIEPHIGKKDIGIKWEEILVVDEHDAYWLDDDLPHVKRWQASDSRRKKIPKLTVVGE